MDKNDKMLDLLERFTMVEDLADFGKMDSLMEEARSLVLQVRKDQEPIKTNPNFWDCNCKENYIHPKTDTKCPLCGAEEDECPDSREDEICDFSMFMNENMFKGVK